MTSSHSTLSAQPKEYSKVSEMIFFVNTLLTDEKNEEIQIKLEEKLISSQGKANDIPNENSIGFNNSQEEMLDGSDHVMSCSTVSNANPASEGDKKLEASLCNPSESVENIVKRNTEEILKDSEWNSPRSDVNVMPVTPRIGPVVIDCNQSDVGTHCRTISQTISETDLDNIEELKITKYPHHTKAKRPVQQVFPTPDVIKNLPSKHFLQNNWTLYYCKAERSRRWEDCMQKVTTITCVEEYWATYNHIHLPSGLSMKCDYYMFKEGIQPMWEDPANVHGGRWLIHVDKPRRFDLIDYYWIELTMALAGELFDDPGVWITGAVVNCRQKGDKISCWVKSYTTEETVKKIGLALKKKLGIPEHVKINYETHAALAQKNSSLIKPVMQI